MNTHVSPEIKQELFNKGWRYELGLDETGQRVENSLGEQRWNEGDLTYVDITIAEVVMWLHEKHGIWIVCTPFYIAEGKRFSADVFSADNKKTSISHYKTPTEAYSFAIDYVLNNLI